MATWFDLRYEREAKKEKIQEYASDLEPLQPTAEDNQINTARHEGVSTDIKTQAEVMAYRRIEEAMRLQFEREKWGIAREAYR